MSEIALNAPRTTIVEPVKPDTPRDLAGHASPVMSAIASAAPPITYATNAQNSTQSSRPPVNASSAMSQTAISARLRESAPPVTLDTMQQVEAQSALNAM
ncbi:unnamed protein product [Sphagnum balticum]